MNTQDSTDFCTTREAAQLLGISVRTAQLWVESGRLDGWKTEGGHRRISLASVEALRLSIRDTEQPGAADSRPETPAAPVDEPLRILVVDDDQVLLKLFRMRMESWGLPVEVHTAHNGFDGLILLGRIIPDLLITDLLMPEMDGFQMLRSLSRSAFRAGTEIVVVTGLTPAAIEARGGLPGDIPVLEKPVHFSRLRDLCEKLLQRRAQLAA